MSVRVAPPLTFDRVLPSLELEAGARIDPHRVRGWFWGSDGDAASLASGSGLDPDVKTVLLVHPLTSDASAGGEGGYWDQLLGTGRALRPWATRILSFNLLGSCFGTSGPADDEFPSRANDTHFPPPVPLTRGDLHEDEHTLPATVTPWDQARSILSALELLGVRKVELVLGGSLGGMVVQCLVMLAPRSFPRAKTRDLKNMIAGQAKDKKPGLSP